MPGFDQPIPNLQWCSPLTARRWSPYILDIYRQALRKYVPQLYPGRAIYFKAEKASSNHQLNWGGLTAGGQEVYEVPGDHMDIRQELAVQLWAGTLQACLAKARPLPT